MEETAMKIREFGAQSGSSEEARDDGEAEDWWRSWWRGWGLVESLGAGREAGGGGKAGGWWRGASGMKKM